MSSALTLVKRAKSFGGSVQQFKHVSACTNTEMVFTVFLPPQAVADATVPVSEQCHLCESPSFSRALPRLVSFAGAVLAVWTHVY